MKPLLTFVFLLVATVSWSQVDASTKINKALSAGDASALKPFLTAKVDLDVDGNEGLFPASEVQKRLSQFFIQHKPSGFTVKHKGTSKLDDHYRIGDLKTSNGNFRVTYFMKTSPKGMQIKQLRIESLE